MQRSMMKVADSQRLWMEHLESLLACAGTERDLLSGPLSDHVCTALIAGCDNWIDEACSRWPQHGRLIRMTAESRSERVTVTRNGVTVHICLFVLALLFEFDEEVPVTQFEACLFPDANAAAALSCVPCRASMLFCPRAYRFEELRHVPLSRVQRAAMALAEGACDGAVPSLPASMQFRRRRTFLRYLSGHQLSHAAAPATHALALDIPVAQDLLTTLVRDRLGAAARVRALFDGTYFENLYAGLWEYQGARVGHLAAQARRELACDVQAVVDVWRTGPLHELSLAFCKPQAGPPSRTYTLLSIPGDPPQRSLDLVCRALREAGVERINAVDHPLPSSASRGKAARTETTLRLPI